MLGIISPGPHGPGGALGSLGGLFPPLRGPLEGPGDALQGDPPPPFTPIVPGVHLIGMACPIGSSVDMRCRKASPVQFTLVVPLLLKRYPEM